MSGSQAQRFVLLLAVINVGLLWLSPEPALSPLPLFGSGLLWASAYPTWRYLLGDEGPIPFVPAVSAVYFCCYGAPAFGARVLRLRGMRIEEQSVVEALALAFAGECLMLLAFYLVPLPRRLPRISLALDLKSLAPRLIAVAYGCVALRVVFM